jgi:hypothetical protein
LEFRNQKIEGASESQKSRKQKLAKMNTKKVFLSLFIAVAALVTFAQNTSAQKLDRIIKRDYQIIEGKISKVTETNVEFTYPNETVVNMIGIGHVARIEFASGRVQTFEATPESAPVQATAEVPATTTGAQTATIQQNMIAILPIPFIETDNMASSEEMSKFAQNDVYNKIIAKSANISPLTVQDIRTTSSLLHKAGIDYKNVEDTPIEDLIAILGVDHILAAKVSYTMKENQSTSTYGSGQTKYDNNKTKGSGYSSTNTNTLKYYYYHVYLDIYKNNTKIYSQNRKPALAVQDSWVDAMAHLLKNTPIYTK